MVTEKPRLRRASSTTDVDGGVLENSRRNETDVGAGATAGARWVPQGRLDQSTAVTVETAVPWTIRDIRKHTTPDVG